MTTYLAAPPSRARTAPREIVIQSLAKWRNCLP
jgi:hypothetical protein